ncbi:MAG TPA: hypothetical protein VEG27_10590 [Usitatibacter sp.]|nr:hypothetical protein [Usitatibacter sp.]
MAPHVSEAPRSGPRPAEPALARKVAFLLRPDSYADGTREVRALETHWSWVFLTDTHAYKLKKPVRHDESDLTTVSARAAHCRMEIALNRRLSEGVYLGAVPLGVDGAGRLRLDKGGEVVDWLVRMRRLPAERMLDRLVQSRRLRDGELRPLVMRLARFYRGCRPEAIGPAELRARLAARIAANTKELCAPEAELSPQLVESVGERQLAFVEEHGALLDRRVALGRIVEGHGDLRPEHVCLEATPQIIDCLEFSRELRVVDVAEELGFLALECERLGAPRVKRELLESYAELAGDRPDPRLVDFYQSVHACVRAKLALWHLREPERDDRERWLRRAAAYVQLAAQHLELAAP